MRFSENDYSIIIDHTRVDLLRKEFLLLKHLHDNLGRTYSRPEILDAIWPMETPTDRTVDDHIYRLRKKLQPYKESYSIETIKGLGYRLTRKNSSEDTQREVPEEISMQATQLIETYYKYGQGKPLKELITNKALGLPITEKEENILLWLASDFKPLLERLSKSESVFVPLLLYGFVEPDAGKVIKAHEKALAMNRVSKKERMDITCFSLPVWHMKKNQSETSIHLVQTELDAIHTKEHGFLPFLHIMKTMILFFQDEMAKANQSLEQSQQILKQFPFLRETGALQVVQGLFLLRTGQEKAGIDDIQSGIQTIEQSGHTYYFLLIHQILELLLPKTGAKSELIHHFKQEADNYYKRINLVKLKPIVERQVLSLI